MLFSLSIDFVYFLLAFPIIQDLLITIKKRKEIESILLHELSLPRLRTFFIKRPIVNEPSMLAFILSHPIKANITLLDAVL